MVVATHLRRSDQFCGFSRSSSPSQPTRVVFADFPSFAACAGDFSRSLTSGCEVSTPAGSHSVEAGDRLGDMS